MQLDRRTLLLSGLALAASRVAPALADELRHVRVGSGPKSIEVSGLNFSIPDTLGLTGKPGFAIDNMPMGSVSNVLIAIDKGAVEFGVMSPSFNLPLFAKGEMPPVVAFYEYTYPYKWDVAVRPGSPIASYQDLRGKKIGVSNIGITDYPVTRMVLRNVGIDPDKDVTWQAVGIGVTAGIALDRGVVDALAYYDTGFGIVENAGIRMRYLPRPPGVPMIGGLFLGARRDFLRDNRALAVAYGRSVAMATEFILANPEAGARAFMEKYPATAPRNVDAAEAVEKTLTMIRRRMTLWRSPYGDDRLGVIHEAEWRAEAEFSNIAIGDPAPLFTNDLIDEINDFDRAAVIAAAKAARI